MCGLPSLTVFGRHADLFASSPAPFSHALQLERLERHVASGLEQDQEQERTPPQRAQQEQLQPGAPPPQRPQVRAACDP